MEDKYLAFQALLEADPESQALRQAFLCASEQLHQLLRRLEPIDQEIIYEYLGTLAEIQMREIELALMQ